MKNQAKNTEAASAPMQLQVCLLKQTVITAGIMGAMMLFVSQFNVPNPNMILIAGLVLCSALFGFGGGGVAATMMLFYTLYFFSDDHSFTQFTPENLQKVGTTLVGVLADMLLVCLLKRAEVREFRKAEQLTQQLHRENRRLQDMSMTDALTGIRNRMALRHDYDSFLGREVTVMMMDLNEFKRINDSLGHREGDRILAETGRLLADTFGAEHCYRYGGDEFLVIVPAESEAQFQQEMNGMLRNRPMVVLEGQSGNVGFSVGYVHALLDQPDALRNLIAAADERMYQAKRDRVPAQPAPPAEPAVVPSEHRLPEAEYTVPQLRSLLGGISGEYDLVRVVDPIECRVLEIHEDGSISRNERCYGIWKADQRCLNCSSSAACNGRCHREKTEQFENQTFHIQSDPVSLKLPDGGVYDAVVEFINVEKTDSAGAVNDRAAENVGNRAAHYQSLHDELTSVLTASAFYEQARDLLSGSRAGSWVMVTGNIMHFRLVNTLFGVQRGNEVLIRTASLLRELTADARGLCGRLGGDQFAVLLSGAQYREEALQSIAQTLAADYHSGLYTLCIHFGVYPVGDPSLPVSVMCDRANAALRTIREDLTRTVAYFDDALMQKAFLRQRIISGFGDALKTGQIRMYLQPLVEEDGRIVGAEALARWCMPDGRILMPGVFIEILEQAGLIHQLDVYMWDLAVQKLRAWQGTERQNLTISVNISAKDFYSVDVYEVLTGLIERYGVESRMLRLEITETALLVEPEKSDAVVSRLRSRGFCVEIDDFGKGYSSLSLLKNIHADVLKIDMNFLREIKDRQRSRMILESVVNLAASLEMEVITEGVETEQQLRALSTMGCRHFQGFYFSRPMPEEEFEACFP